MSRQFNIRREARDRIAMPGRLRRNVTCRTEVGVLDLSPNGCRIDTGGSLLAIGSPVFVRLDQLGAVRATVRWQEDRIAGLEFDSPLYPPVVDHLVANWPEQGGVVGAVEHAAPFLLADRNDSSSPLVLPTSRSPQTNGSNMD